MEVNDPDLDAFESATCAQLWARELGKIGALIPISSQTLLSLSRWENQATKMLNDDLNAAHHLSDLTSSLILTNHRKILKNLQNGFFKSIFSSVLTDGVQMKLTKQKFGQWWNCNIYQNFLSLSSTWQFCIIQWLNPTEMFWNCLYEAMYRRIPQANYSGENN